MNRVDQPEAWDLTLAGITWSGTAEVAGLKYSMGWDIQDADGKNGASLARKGRKLSQFTIRFGMVVDPTQGIDQFSEWYETWLPLLKSCFVGTAPVGLTLEHAEAQALEVDSIVVADIGQVQRVGDDDGDGVVDVAVIQYAPAKTVGTGGPNGSKSGTGSKSGAGAGGDDPDDEIQKKLNALNALLDGP